MWIMAIMTELAVRGFGHSAITICTSAPGYCCCYDSIWLAVLQFVFATLISIITSLLGCSDRLDSVSCLVIRTRCLGVLFKLNICECVLHLDTGS